MDLNNNYSFTVSVSSRPFQDKESAKAGSNKMRFQKMELNPEMFLSLAGAGYAFCYNFCNDRRRKENFLNTEILVYDIDYPVVEIGNYIDGLPYKPTMAYTTYSNDPGINHFRFRLVYCFDSPITTETEFITYFLAINSANGFGKTLDNQSRLINQAYYGSNKQIPGFQDYNSQIVYSFNDFREYFPDQREINRYLSKEVSITDHTHNSDDDWNTTLSAEELHNYYKNYVDSLATPLVLAPSHTHYTYPEEYYAVPIRIITQDGKRVIKKWHDGERRRQKLYVSAQIMLKNVPTLTPGNLSFNLWQLIRVYYDNRKDKITKDDIDGIVERAFERRYTYNLQPTKHKGIFRINKEYWASLGITPRKAVPMVMKERNMSIMDYYDPSLSIKENYNNLLEMDLDIGYQSLCRYVNDLGLKRDIYSEILDLMRQVPDISIQDVATALGKSPSTISRRIKELKEGDNPRVKRKKKQWIVRDTTEAYPEMDMPL